MEGTKEFTRNTRTLVLGEIIISILSFGFNFFLAIVLSVDEYSYFNRILVVPMILLFFSDIGIYNGCLYYTARFNKLKKKKKLRNVIKITLITKSIIGLCFSLIFFLMSVKIIAPLLGINDTSIYPILQITSILLITKNLLEGIWAALIGLSKMKTLILVRIILNGIQSISTIILVLLGWRLFGPIIGLLFSTGIAGIFGTIYIQKRILKNDKKKEDLNWKFFPQIIKRGYLYSLNSIIYNTKNYFFILILSLLSLFSEVSYLRVGVSIATNFYLILRPVTTSVTPIFSKYSWNDSNDRKNLIQVFQYSIKFFQMFLSPIMIFLIIFGPQLVPLVYGMKYLPGVYFMSIFFISYLPLTLGMAILPSFFFGQRYSKLAFLLDFIPFLSGICLGIFFSFIIGSLGFVIGIVLGTFFGFLFGFVTTNRVFGKVLFSNIKESLLIMIIAGLLCSFFFLSNYFFTIIFNIEYFIFRLLLIGGFFLIFYTVFLILLIRIKVLNFEEITYFVNEFRNVPLFNKILPFLANIAKKLIKNND